jgi:hypothetical protein
VGERTAGNVSPGRYAIGLQAPRLLAAYGYIKRQKFTGRTLASWQSSMESLVMNQVPYIKTDTDF